MSIDAVGADQSNIMVIGDVIREDIRHSQAGFRHEGVARQEVDIAIQMPRSAGMVNERRFPTRQAL